MLIALWTSGRFFQEEIARAATKPTAVALAETLQMAGGGASRTDVMELCAAVLHVKSGCGWTRTTGGMIIIQLMAPLNCRSCSSCPWLQGYHSSTVLNDSVSSVQAIHAGGREAVSRLGRWDAAQRLHMWLSPICLLPVSRCPHAVPLTRVLSYTGASG